MSFGCGLSGHLDAVTAAEQACDRALEDLTGGTDPSKASDSDTGSGASSEAGSEAGSGVDLVVLFCSGEHAKQADQIAAIARARLSPTTLIGTTAASLVGGASELENAAGISVLAARLPGVSIHPFDQRDILPFDDTSPRGLERLAEGMGLTAGGLEARGTMLFVDPFSVPMVRLLPALNRARLNTAPIFGGMAAAASEPGGNAMILNDSIADRGLVGVTFHGAITIDTVISQGCRAIGPNFVVTKAKNNMILELGGQPALEVVQQTLGDLGQETQDLLRKGGLLIGRVVDEYKERFGRDDYLIRNVVGADEASNGVAWGDMIRVGQTVSMHVRDPQSASDDLAMLLDAQKLRSRPAGALVFPCTSRGEAFFGEPNHDASAMVRAFAGRAVPAEESARSGQQIQTWHKALPQAGFFAAGEIGPVGGEAFLHGHTLSAALFRDPQEQDQT
ncbi:FIST C-terminal domain-containing protein [Roseiflexus sp. AH-315-K22]|nr:FIST C-terminal domain-containing protein [Roseiflexus sp. AH-315-K22]